MNRRDARRSALGILLKLWREGVHDIRQTELEEAVGLSTGRVSKIERGQSEPRPEEMDRIARYFDTTAAQWEELARPIEEHLAKMQSGLTRDGDYPPAAVDPSVIVDRPAPSLDLPPELVARWERQHADEQRVRKNRDLLELESHRCLLRRVLGRT